MDKKFISSILKGNSANHGLFTLTGNKYWGKFLDSLRLLLAGNPDLA